MLAIGLTSTYSLGLPISGYQSSTSDKEDQWTDTGEFLWNEFDSFLKSANFDGVEVYWSDSEDGMVWAEESKFFGGLITASLIDSYWQLDIPHSVGTLNNGLDGRQANLPCSRWPFSQPVC